MFMAVIIFVYERNDFMIEGAFMVINHDFFKHITLWKKIAFEILFVIQVQTKEV